LTGITVKNDLGEIIRTAEYTYDVYNQRIAKTVDADGDGSLAAVTERFVYGRDQNIALVLDENGNVNHRYLFGNGVDQIEADESNGNVRWALTDHLGSVRDVVDNSGTVLNHIVYDAFGGVTSQTNESVVFRYGYTARELDTESGLQYNRARYLDSFTGKFISEDPISFKGGDSNLYRYVFNSPIRYTDPMGLFVPSSTPTLLGILAAPVLLIFDLIFPQPAEAPNFTSNPQVSKKRNPAPIPSPSPKPTPIPLPAADDYFPSNPQASKTPRPLPTLLPNPFASPPNPNMCLATEEQKPTCKTVFPHIVPYTDPGLGRYLFSDAEDAKIAAFPNGVRRNPAQATKGPCSIYSGYEPGTHWNVKDKDTGYQLGSVGQCNVCFETSLGPVIRPRGAVLSSESH
jgi:RHS repeat-associated protein